MYAGVVDIRNGQVVYFKHEICKKILKKIRNDETCRCILTRYHQKNKYIYGTKRKCVKIVLKK